MEGQIKPAYLNIRCSSIGEHSKFYEFLETNCLVRLPKTDYSSSIIVGFIVGWNVRRLECRGEGIRGKVMDFDVVEMVEGWFGPRGFSISLLLLPGRGWGASFVVGERERFFGRIFSWALRSPYSIFSSGHENFSDHSSFTGSSAASQQQMKTKAVPMGGWRFGDFSTFSTLPATESHAPRYRLKQNPWDICHSVSLLLSL